MSEEREEGEEGEHGEHGEHGADHAFDDGSYADRRPGGFVWSRTLRKIAGTIVALLLGVVPWPTAWPQAKAPQFGAALVLGAPPVATVTTPAVVLADTVWANEKSRVYHCPGTRYFGATKRGLYLSEAIALKRGYRGVGGKRCRALSNLAPETSHDAAGRSVDGHASTAEASTAEASTAEASTAEASTVKVWVNTASGVYHCAGSRYYGETARGKFMTEADARTKGHRGVRGKSCD